MDSTIVRLLLAAGSLGAALLSSRTLLHDFQLESYQYHGYFRTVLRSLKQTVLPGALHFAVPASSVPEPSDAPVPAL